MAYLEAIRAIPDAAPLLDDVLAYLREGHEAEFSLSNLPTNENGLAKLDGRSSEAMIKDPEIRAKWDKLMDLIAAHGH